MYHRNYNAGWKNQFLVTPLTRYFALFCKCTVHPCCFHSSLDLLQIHHIKVPSATNQHNEEYW